MNHSNVHWSLAVERKNTQSSAVCVAGLEHLITSSDTSEPTILRELQDCLPKGKNLFLGVTGGKLQQIMIVCDSDLTNALQLYSLLSRDSLKEEF